MMSDSTLYHLYVGVDVAAQTVTVAWMEPGGRPSPALTVAQTPSGFAALQTRLEETGHAPPATLVVMEATGPYWVTLATTLSQAGFAVAVVNPTQAHHFAKALLKRAKTDAVDARMLAQLAATLQPTPWTPPPAVYTEIQQRLLQRDALVGLRQQARNQRHALVRLPTVVAAVKERLDVLIAMLDAQIEATEAELTEVMRQDPRWAANADLLLSITGIGLLTAAWLLVATVNFELCPTVEAATAYVGLAPYPRESGTSVRGRPAIGHGGHRRLRTALYLATLSAGQHNPLIKTFYERLKANGKPKKVARCAAARKLLHLAWAVVRSGRAFDPTYRQDMLAAA